MQDLTRLFLKSKPSRSSEKEEQTCSKECTVLPPSIHTHIRTYKLQHCTESIYLGNTSNQSLKPNLLFQSGELIVHPILSLQRFAVHKAMNVGLADEHVTVWSFWPYDIWCASIIEKTDQVSRTGVVWCGPRPILPPAGETKLRA
jgi:hypothetical protein